MCVCVCVCVFCVTVCAVHRGITNDVAFATKRPIRGELPGADVMSQCTACRHGTLCARQAKRMTWIMDGAREVEKLQDGRYLNAAKLAQL